MFPFIEERIAYGRSIRQRAACLLEAYGPMAQTEALKAAREPGMAEAERVFWEAVASRVARELGEGARLRA
jgi:hypothetical protein